MKSGEKKMSRHGRAERMLIAGIVVLALMVCALAAGVVWLLTSDQTPEISPVARTANREALATPEDRLPENLSVGCAPPRAVFADEAGERVTLESLTDTGKNGVWLVFWASWCPDCDAQFEYGAQMQSLAEEYGVDLVLVDRLNPEKETIEAAKRKLELAGISARCVYDPDEVCYKTWGMREIPSAVVLDGKGIVREYRSGKMTAGECAGMLRRAIEGRDSAGFAFVQSALSNGEGGVCTSTADSGASPTGRDVLSESQGLMMQYALEKDDQALFDSAWAFTRDIMMRDGLTAWYVNANGVQADVNALLDDLRLWQALRDADAKWGGDYAAQAARIAKAVSTRCVNAQGALVDFAALNGAEQADTIALCYLDLSTLSAMAMQTPAMATALERARSVLLGGRISDEFPLYYASYSYREGTYGHAPLNSAEALVTLLNLARAGELPDDALDWVRQRVTDGDLAARYEVTGEPVNGYEYHSPAVYGLAALIARASGDDAMFELAVRRMERGCTMDLDDARYGAYGQKNLAAHSFDQLIALQVNAALASKGRES